MSCFYLMIGAPASGKTTVALQIRQASSAFLINPDLIRERFRWPNGKIFDYAFYRLSAAVARGQTVILDATSAQIEHRLQAIAFAQHRQIPIIGVWLDTPLAVCLHRHEHRLTNHSQSTLTPETIARYDQQLRTQPPSLREGFDRLVRITPADDAAALLNLNPPLTP